MSAKLINQASDIYTDEEFAQAYKFVSKYLLSGGGRYHTTRITLMSTGKDNRWRGYATWPDGHIDIWVGKKFGPIVRRKVSENGPVTILIYGKMDYLVTALAHEMTHIHIADEGHMIVHQEEDRIHELWVAQHGRPLWVKVVSPLFTLVEVLKGHLSS
jgi:hypothetical protein